VGLTRGTTRAHLARAALEAIAYQTREVVEAMQADAGLALPTLRADGGAAANDVLMQIQSDLLGAPVERPAQVEATAWGAAALAGVAAGLFGPADLAARWTADARFEPKPCADAGYADWLDAVALARRWAAR
jgi:glycerol kinase